MRIFKTRFPFCKSKVLSYIRTLMLRFKPNKGMKPNYYKQNSYLYYLKVIKSVYEYTFTVKTKLYCKLIFECFVTISITRYKMIW